MEKFRRLFENEKRARLGLDRLDESLGPRGKKHSRETLLIASEYKAAMGGDDAALAKAVRRYTDHQVEIVLNCEQPAVSYLWENYRPEKINEALLLLGIATPNTAFEFAMFGEGPEVFLECWAVIAARRRRPLEDIPQGLFDFCVSFPEPDPGRDKYD